MTTVSAVDDLKEVAAFINVSVTCLATPGHFAPFLEDESREFIEGEENVRATWTNSVKAGGVVLAQPEHYITLKEE